MSSGEVGTEKVVDAALIAALESLATEFPRHARVEVLERGAAALEAGIEEFARTISDEVGKPIRAARVEAERAVATLRESAVVAKTLVGQPVALDAVAAGAGKIGWTERVPLGVVVAITPFNFPLNLVCHKVGPALAAGNAVVLKPAEQAPETASLLCRLLADAGLPADRLQLLHGGPDLGAALVRSEAVDAITFTGSSAVGWDIRAANPRARVLLELGSTAPLIVCADGDVAAAALATARHAFSFAGQSCISIQRVIVDHRVEEDFLEKLRRATGQLVVGDPGDSGTDVGPLIDGRAAERVCTWIEEAVEGGGELAAGGRRIDDRTVAPSVVARCPTGSRLWREEVFGPVVAVVSCDSVRGAIELANDSDFGLQAGVFTSSLTTALECARRLEFGAVLINEVPTFRVDHQPYGGVRSSGSGKEGPAWAAQELSEERLVSLQDAPAH